jgi:WD40 repeat protein
MKSSLLVSALAAGLLCAPARADNAKAALRVLREECIGCHKPGKAKGGLILNTREKLMVGGDSGASVLIGKGNSSLLVEVLLKDGDPHMPPKKQLSSEAVASVRQWIDEGAKWDATVFDELPTVKPVQLGKLPNNYRPALAIGLSGDQTRLAVARGESVEIHDLSKPDRPVIQSLHGHVEAIQSLAWSIDGQRLATGGFRSFKLWDVANGRETKSLTSSLIGNITGLLFTLDGKQILAADGEAGVSGFIHRIDAITGKILGNWKAHDDVIYGMRLSVDGSLLATGSADKLARIWTVTDGKLNGTYEGHTNHVLGVAFDKDASRLATASADKEVKVWDVKTRGQEVTLGNKKLAFTAVDWSSKAEGLVIITEKGDGSLFGELVRHTGVRYGGDNAKERRLERASQGLYCAVISADGKTIYGGGYNGTVYVWDSTGKITARLRGL